MHADLNVPRAVSAGALDWMGVAHLLREDGAEHELSSALPVVKHDRVVLFSHLEDEATAHEREAIERLGLDRVPLDEVARDPEGAAAAALELIEARCERFVIHFDVDVVDFVDAPLSEARDRNIGLALDSALRALRVLARSAQGERADRHGAEPGPRRRGRLDAAPLRRGPGRRPRPLSVPKAAACWEGRLRVARLGWWKATQPPQKETSK